MASPKLKEVLLVSWPLVAVAFVLRPLVTSLGPVLPEIRADFGLSATAASLLSTLPVLCFGFGAIFVPRLLSHIGPNRAVSWGLLIITIGGTLRVLPNVLAMFIGTTLIGLGVAVGNVTVSIISRRDFASSLGIVMGLTTGGISLTASFAAMMTYPLSQAIGSWRLALFVWAAYSGLTWFAWQIYCRKHRNDLTLGQAPSIFSQLKSKYAWALVFYFGLQSTNFHSLVAWLPSMMRDAGIAPTTAGLLLAYMVLIGVPTGLFVPPIAERSQRHLALVTLLVAAFGFGLLGMYFLPTTGTWLWVTLLGFGLGATFPLILTVVVLRAESPQVARDLTAFMQSGGYLISAIGPLVLGALYDYFQTWSVAYIALGVALIGQQISGWVITHPKHRR
jgi:CP family cyanate transporter-like MFS transporter